MAQFSKALVRLSSSILGELRIAWARGWRVSLQIAGDETRIEGHVTSVAATGSYVVVAGLHVPMEAVLAIYRPSRLGDSTYASGETWAGGIPLREDPHQLRIPGLDEA